MTQTNHFKHHFQSNCMTKFQSFSVWPAYLFMIDVYLFFIIIYFFIYLLFLVLHFIHNCFFCCFFFYSSTYCDKESFSVYLLFDRCLEPYLRIFRWYNNRWHVTVGGNWAVPVGNLHYHLQVAADLHLYSIEWFDYILLEALLWSYHPGSIKITYY